MSEETKAYYAVIPANVRYDKAIPMGAKLLYGEITALCNEKGFCWATNSYFAELYEMTDKTIMRWVNALVNGKYVTKNIEYAEDGKTVLRRYLSIPNVPTYGQKCHGGTDKNVPTPTDKNVRENNTIMNNTDENNIYTRTRGNSRTVKPFVPPSLDEVRAYASEKGYTELAEKFYRYYTLTDWTDKYGKKVKSWKQRFCTWIVSNSVVHSDSDKPSSNNSNDEFERTDDGSFDLNGYKLYGG